MRKFSKNYKSKLFRGFLCLIPALSLLAFSCAPKEAIKKQLYGRGAPEEAQEASGEASYHVIKKGETLYSVSRRYGVSINELQRANNIKDVRDIEVGTKLVIPDRRTAAQAKKRRARKTPKTTYAPVTRTRFMWPLKKFRISSRFGIRKSKKHDGIDLRAPRGTPILAAADGKVIFSGQGPSGYGKIVIIKHDGGSISVYAHNEKNIAVKGRSVKMGETIATVGRSGRADGYHLHFELRINRKPVDPEKYLPRLR